MPYIKKLPTGERYCQLNKTERRHMANVADHLDLLGDCFAEVRGLSDRFHALVQLIEGSNGVYSTPVVGDDEPDMPQDAHETIDETGIRKPKQSAKQGDIPF